MVSHVRVIGVLTALWSIAPELGAQQVANAVPRTGTASVNDVRLHYLDWGGDGETVVLLPGFGNTAHAFATLAPKLADSFRVVALTRRGHGESEKPAHGYSVSHFVEDLRHFLDDLGVQRAHLIGHSMAGSDITGFAAVYPERVISLTYLDGLSYMTHPDLTCYLQDPALPTAWRKLFLELADSAGAAQVLLPSNVSTAEYRHTLIMFREGIAGLSRSYLNVSAPALALVADTAAVEGPAENAPYKICLRDIRVRKYQQFRQEMARGELVVLPKAGHNYYLDQPEDTARRIREFLSRAR